MICSDKFVLRLYVMGKTTRSNAAIQTLRDLCNSRLGSNYELEIIDVLNDPQTAEDDRILATPTVLRRFPTPVRKVIGDLSDIASVCRGLDIAMEPPTED